MDVSKIKQAYTIILFEVRKLERILASTRPDMPDVGNIQAKLDRRRGEILYIRNRLYKALGQIDKIK